MLLETVYNFLRRTYPLTLVAGEEGIHQQMTWFHLLENITQSEFIRGNELVFTTGLSYREEEWLVDFAEKLHRHKACGLVVNIGPYITEIPQRVIDLCDACALPLFAVPWRVRLVDMTRDLSQLIIENERTRYQSVVAMKNAILNPQGEEYKALLAEAGYSRDGRYCAAQIVGFDGVQDREEVVEAIRGFLLRTGGSLVFSLNAGIVLIFASLTEETVKKTAKTLCAELKKLYPKESFRVGVGDIGRGIGTVAESYRQAGCALRVALINQSPCVFYNETGLYQILFAVEDRAVLVRFADEVLGQIIRYDKSHKTDYLKWLELYIRCDGSIKRIAEESYCHRNTVNFKIKKIRDLFGLTLHSNTEKAAIFVALETNRLLHSEAFAVE